MKETLYGDVLFLVNFSMDYLTLFITAKLMHRKLRPVLMTLSAVIGGVYGVAACFMNGAVLYRIPIDIAVSLLMCYISFGKGILPCCAVFYMSGCLLGGGMTALYSLIGTGGGGKAVYVDGKYRTVGGSIPLGWMTVTALLIGAAAAAVGKVSEKKRLTESIEFTVKLNRRTAVFTGICDTGNLLVDCTSGLPVIVLSSNAAERILPHEVCTVISSREIGDLTGLPPEFLPKMKIIPISTADGEGILTGFRPDELVINGVKKDGIIAVGKYCGDHGGRDAVVPPSLV